MSFVTIPMFDLPSFSESVTLDGKEYQLSFAWNSRGAFWKMMIADSNGTIISTGIRLCISYPLKRQHTDNRLPPGEFLVMDANTKTAQIEPGRHDFVKDRKLQLVYWGVN